MPPSDNIEHVVVLMMENRSFDHMLGFLPHPEPGFRGLTGRESNPVDPKRPYGERVPVSRVNEPETVTADPGHGFGDVMRQLYGRNRAWRSSSRQMPSNDGFVWVHGRRTDRARAGEVMRVFAPERVPVLSELAMQFAVCDMWFSPVPGETWPNRMFVHAATSAGTVNNVLGWYKLDTIFHRLDLAGRSWRVYRDGVTQVGAFVGLQQAGAERFCPFERFTEDAANDALPAYAFIEPDHFAPGKNSQHPVQNIAHGEQLIARVYRALRESPAWTRSLLVITYDEHGGFFDHVPPPVTVAPDDKRPPAFSSFAFRRLGPRVPAVLVSPWIERHTVDHTVYDHTAIIKSLRHRFGITQPLGNRDAWVGHFWHNLRREQPRTDLVEVAPLPTDDPAEDLLLELDGLQAEMVRFAQQLEASVGGGGGNEATRVLAGRPWGSVYSFPLRRRVFDRVEAARDYVRAIRERGIG